MINKIMSSAWLKRLAVFALVFVLTGVLLSLQLSSPRVEPTSAPVEESAAPVYREAETMVVSLSSSRSEPSIFDALEVEIDDEPVPEAQPDGFVYLSEVPMAEELQRYTYERCDELDIDYPLVLAIMWRESRFQTNAVNVNTNGTRDNGLMQINDVNREWLRREHDITDLLDPVQNIDAGTAMLATYMAKYGERQALLAYQYGEQGMLSRWRQGITTNSLTELVMDKRDEYRGLLELAALQLDEEQQELPQLDLDEDQPLQLN